MSSVEPSAGHWMLEYERSRRLIRLNRTSRGYADIIDFEASCGELAAGMRGIARDRHALLVDLRGCQGRNDAEFESAVASFRKVLIAGYAASAILVGTRVGWMQVRRQIADERAASEVFMEEALALAYLSE